MRDVPGVALRTRDRVKSAAAEVGYVSNVSGSRLATGKTGTIAIVVPTAAKWFFGQAIAGAGAVIRGAGLDVLLYELGDAPGRQRFFTEHGLRGRADAVLVLSLNLSDSETRLLQQLGVPVAVLGVGPASFSSVVVNDQLAAESALRHLINLGHEVIGLIGIDNGSDVTSGSVPPLARVAGYRAALSSAGVILDPDLEHLDENSAAGGAAAMTRLISGPVMPTAVFAASDEMAFGALQVLRSAGIRVPVDMSIVGFDNHDFAAVVDLTTVDQNVPAQGEAAARLVLAALGDPGAAPTTASVSTRLVIRRSTAPPRPLRLRPEATDTTQN